MVIRFQVVIVDVDIINTQLYLHQCRQPNEFIGFVCESIETDRTDESNATST